MIKLPKTVPIPAPEPATPTVAAPAPMNLAAVSMSLDTALVWNSRRVSCPWETPAGCRTQEKKYANATLKHKYSLIKHNHHLSSTQGKARSAKLTKPSPIWARTYAPIAAILSMDKLTPPISAGTIKHHRQRAQKYLARFTTQEPHLYSLNLRPAENRHCNWSGQSPGTAPELK